MGGRPGGLSAPVAGLLTVLTLGGLLVLAVWWFQRSLIYFPDTSEPPPAAEVVPGAEEITVVTQDGLQLAAWYVPASPGCRGAVLVAPGNGGNRAHRADLARGIGGLGLGVLLVEYRGYGGNPGAPSQAGLATDVRAAREALLARHDAPTDLVYLGESIGAAVVAELATEHRPAALVLRSPFSSLADAGRAAYGVPVGWLLRDRFQVADHVAELSVPVAVVYGAGDSIVPPAQSREVAEAARAGGNRVVEVEVPGADHNDPVLAHGEPLLRALAEVAALAAIDGCG